MVLELFTLAGLALGSNLSSQAESAVSAGAAIAAAASQALGQGAVFDGAARSVSNWRFEAARNLDAPAPALARIVSDAAAATPRCVKLNNYWCVKRAGWAGEIASDAEGHVAFASAAEGAVVTAMLLRRYYLVYQRRSAFAILSRWAPARCGPGTSAGAARPAAAHLAGIAPRGIGNTLRARWLAAHRPGFATAKTAKTLAPRIHRSVVASRPVRLMAAPEIAIGMGETSRFSTPVRLASLEAPSLAPLMEAPSCTDESIRVRNYALRVIEGVAATPEEDLRLFSDDGVAGPNLARVMQNMAKVEIGPFAAQGALVSDAIAAEARRERANRPGPPAP